MSDNFGNCSGEAPPYSSPRLNVRQLAWERYCFCYCKLLLFVLFIKCRDGDLTVSFRPWLRVMRRWFCVVSIPRVAAHAPRCMWLGGKHSCLTHEFVHAPLLSRCVHLGVRLCTCICTGYCESQTDKTVPTVPTVPVKVSVGKCCCSRWQHDVCKCSAINPTRSQLQHDSDERQYEIVHGV